MFALPNIVTKWQQVKQMLRIWLLWSQKMHQMEIYAPLESFPSSATLFPYLSRGKGGRDETQQALAFSEMIKMFINTEPSR